jgi:hypothetical protein
MPVIEIIPWIAAFAVLLSVVWIVLVSWSNGISPMPASKAVRLAVAAEVDRTPGYGNIIEAGSGWGTLALDVIRYCPGKRLTGIENSSLPLWCSRLLIRFLPLTAGREGLRNRLYFKRGNIYKCTYDDADIVLCYLFPGAMERLAEKFRQELPRGATVISVCFALPGRQPIRTITCKDSLQTKVYVYRY